MLSHVQYLGLLRDSECEAALQSSAIYIYMFGVQQFRLNPCRNCVQSYNRNRNILFEKYTSNTQAYEYKSNYIHSITQTFAHKCTLYSFLFFLSLFSLFF